MSLAQQQLGEGQKGNGNGAKISLTTVAANSFKLLRIGNSMNTQNKPVLVSATAGAVAGSIIVATLFYVFTGGEADRALNVATVTSSTAPDTSDESRRFSTMPAPGLNSGDRARIAQVETRLGDVAKSIAKLQPEIRSVKTSGASGTDEEAAADAFDIEEARQKELEFWEQKKESFELEEVDNAWAYDARDAFVTDVSDIAQQNGIKVIEADCRTTQCQVVVEWPTYDDAVVGFGELLHHEYQINCAKETLLPEPVTTDPNLPYQMTVLFDCSGARG